MAELVDALTSWQSMLLVLLVFGVAPGVVLRLLLFAYPRQHPRRQELMAELYAVPRLERPLWVSEKVELALFEGLPARHQVRVAKKRGRRLRHDEARWVVWTEPDWADRTMVQDPAVAFVLRGYLTPYVWRDDWDDAPPGWPPYPLHG